MFNINYKVNIKKKKKKKRKEKHKLSLYFNNVQQIYNRIRGGGWGWGLQFIYQEDGKSKLFIYIVLREILCS